MSKEKESLLRAIVNEFSKVSLKRLAILSAAVAVAVFLWRVGEDVLKDTENFGSDTPTQSEELDSKPGGVELSTPAPR